MVVVPSAAACFPLGTSSTISAWTGSSGPSMAGSGLLVAWRGVGSGSGWELQGLAEGSSSAGQHWEQRGWDPRASPVSFQPPAAPCLPAPACGMGQRAQGPPCEALVLPGAAAGAQGHVRAGTDGAGKCKAVRRVLGRGWRPGCRAGTPWQAAQSRLCERPALPAPLGNSTGLLSGAGWQSGHGPTAPRCPLPPSASLPPCDGSPPHPRVHMPDPHHGDRQTVTCLQGGMQDDPQPQEDAASPSPHCCRSP